LVGDGPWFWAAPFEQGSEFGGRGFPARLPPGALDPRTKGTIRASTTLVVVATDAALTRPQATRLAIMAQDGLARAIFPVHTPLDGDVVFVAATGAPPLVDPVLDPMRIGTFAVQVLALSPRACGEATALPVSVAGTLTGPEGTASRFRPGDAFGA
jgi:L-aminopeptidase/D-esterase-like protein